MYIANSGVISCSTVWSTKLNVCSEFMVTGKGTILDWLLSWLKHYGNQSYDHQISFRGDPWLLDKTPRSILNFMQIQDHFYSIEGTYSCVGELILMWMSLFWLMWVNHMEISWLFSPRVAYNSVWSYVGKFCCHTQNYFDYRTLLAVSEFWPYTWNGHWKLSAIFGKSKSQAHNCSYSYCHAHFPNNYIFIYNVYIIHLSIFFIDHVLYYFNTNK